MSQVIFHDYRKAQTHRITDPLIGFESIFYLPHYQILKQIYILIIRNCEDLCLFWNKISGMSQRLTISRCFMSSLIIDSVTRSPSEINILQHNFKTFSRYIIAWKTNCSGLCPFGSIPETVSNTTKILMSILTRLVPSYIMKAYAYISWNITLEIKVS